MSSGLIILIIVIGVLLVLGYVVAVLLRKRNEALLASLEERKEELYNLPVNDEVEAVVKVKLHFVNGIKNGWTYPSILLLISRTTSLKQKATTILSAS